MHKSSLFLFILLASLPTIFCGVEIKTSPISTQVKSGEIVSYYLYINNTDMWNKTATIFLLTDKIYGIEPTYYLVLPGLTQTVAKINLMVPSSIVAQRYYEDVFIKFSDFTEATQRISYDVKGPELYLKLNSISINPEIDPSEEIILTVNIENNYYEKAKTALLNINFYDEAGDSVYYVSKSLDLLEGVNDYEVVLNLDQKLSSNYLKVVVSMKWFDLNLGSEEATVTLKNLGQGLNKVYRISSIILTNNKAFASPPYVEEKPINFVEAFLIKSASVPYALTSSSILYEVPLLNPGESITLSYELDYFLPLAILVLIIVFSYFYLSKTVKVKKEIKEIKAGNNSLDFKIVVNVTNVGSKKLKNLRVKEFLPSIISDVYGFGTVIGEVKPISKQKFIVWEVKNLKPLENVVLSYRVKTRMGFIGELLLDNSSVEILNDESKVSKKIATPKLILIVNQAKKKTENMQQ